MSALSEPTGIRPALIDGVTVMRRNLWQVRRQPSEVLGALIFPAIMVLLFGYVFGSAISVPGGGNYREYLMPGLFGMTALTAIMATTMTTAEDASRGIMDRFRSMPISRVAVPFGQTAADIILGCLAMTGMVACALAVGWRAHNGILATAAGFALLLLFRYAMSWAGVYLGLAVKSEKTADNLVPLTLPAAMLANTYVPTDGMPTWLRVICNWNPVSSVAAACRQLFGNPGVATVHTALPLEHPVLSTIIWSVLLMAIFVPLSIRSWQRANN